MFSGLHRQIHERPYAITTQRYGQDIEYRRVFEPSPLQSHRLEADRQMHGYIPARRGEAGFRRQTGISESPWTRQYNRDLDRKVREAQDQQMHNMFLYQKPDQNTMSPLFPILDGGKKQGGRSVSYSNDFGHQFGDTRQALMCVQPQRDYTPAVLGGSAVTNRPACHSHVGSKEFEMDQVQRMHGYHADHQQRHLNAESDRPQVPSIALKPLHQAQSLVPIQPYMATVSNQPVRHTTQQQPLHPHSVQPSMHTQPTHVGRSPTHQVAVLPNIHSQSLKPMQWVVPVLTSIKTPHVMTHLPPTPIHYTGPNHPKHEETFQSHHTKAPCPLDTHTPHAVMQPSYPHQQSVSSHMDPVPVHLQAITPDRRNSALIHHPVESNHGMARPVIPLVHHALNPDTATKHMETGSNHVQPNNQMVTPHLEQKASLAIPTQDTTMAKPLREDHFTDGISRGPNFREESLTSAQNNHFTYTTSRSHDTPDQVIDTHQAALTKQVQVARRQDVFQDKPLSDRVSEDRKSIR
jgi:hypothetical protein